MDCILDKALSGLNPLSVRIVLNTGTFPKPAQEAVKLSNDTLNDTARSTDSKLCLSKIFVQLYFLSAKTLNFLQIDALYDSRHICLVFYTAIFRDMCIFVNFIINIQSMLFILFDTFLTITMTKSNQHHAFVKYFTNPKASHFTHISRKKVTVNIRSM